MGNYKKNQSSGVITSDISSKRRIKIQKHRQYQFKFQRKILHLSFSTFGFLLIFDPHRAFTYKVALATLTIFMFFLDTLRLVFPKVNEKIYQIFKGLFISRDFNKYSSGTYYLIGCLITALIFPPLMAGIGILYLGFGDFFAALGGTYLKKILPFQMPFTHKTYLGFLCFILSTTSIGILLGFSAVASLSASVIASLFEVYPILDDNLTIPLATSTIIYLFYM